MQSETREIMYKGCVNNLCIKAEELDNNENAGCLMRSVMLQSVHPQNVNNTPRVVYCGFLV